MPPLPITLIELKKWYRDRSCAGLPRSSVARAAPVMRIVPGGQKHGRSGRALLESSRQDEREKPIRPNEMGDVERCRSSAAEMSRDPKATRYCRKIAALFSGAKEAP